VSGGSDALFAHFEVLLALPAAERAAAVAALEVDEDTRAELSALLDADARGDTRLERAVEGGAQRLSTLPTGLRLGPWKVLREIGAGGMGTVFLGERADGAFAQQVAIKVLRGFPTEDGMRRLRQERRILAELDHPNIARLLDGGETPEGQPYLVMEYVDGVALADWLAQASAQVAPRLALFDKLAAAVAHAHRQLVIHRDLKPGNVIVRADGEPKLLDFGVARLTALDAGDSSTRVASLGWSSPEQAAGGAVTTASDVYSLGVLLRVLLGGRDDREPDAPLPLADAELRGVVAMATAADPARRYPGVEALREDLLAWRDRRPLRALPDTAVYRARKFVRRHRIGVAASLVVAAGIAAFVAGLDRALAEARSQREIAQRVGDFMVDMFTQATPSLTEGRELTAREVVAAASQRLLDDAQLDAQVRVRLLERVAMLNINLRDLDAARTHIEAADAHRKQVPSAVGAQIDFTFARILARAGDMDGAMQRNAAALAVAGAADTEPGLLASILQQAMWLANRRGDYRRTLELAPQALAAAERSHEGAASRVTILNSRAFAEGQLGQYDAELASLRLAEEFSRQATGSSTMSRSVTALNLASGLRLRGRLDEADEVLDRLEAYGREAFSTDHRDELVRILAERSRLAARRGDGERALRAIDEAIAIEDQLPAAQRAGSLWVVRAEALHLGGRHAEALHEIDASGVALADARASDDIGAALLRVLRSAARCALGRTADAAEDAAAARLHIAMSPPAQLERLAIERRLAELPASCRP
jgi:serine/threonine-protein kinase